VLHDTRLETLSRDKSLAYFAHLKAKKKMERKNCPNYFWCYIHKPISLLCHAIALSLSLSPVLRTGQFLSKLGFLRTSHTYVKPSSSERKNFHTGVGFFTVE
jgi:hypothetical protein